MRASVQPDSRDTGNVQVHGDRAATVQRDVSSAHLLHRARDRAVYGRGVLDQCASRLGPCSLGQDGGDGAGAAFRAAAPRKSIRRVVTRFLRRPLPPANRVAAWGWAAAGPSGIPPPRSRPSRPRSPAPGFSSIAEPTPPRRPLSPRPRKWPSFSSTSLRPKAATSTYIGRPSGRG